MLGKNFLWQHQWVRVIITWFRGYSFQIVVLLHALSLVEESMLHIRWIAALNMVNVRTPYSLSDIWDINIMFVVVWFCGCHSFARSLDPEFLQSFLQKGFFPWLLFKLKKEEISLKNTCRLFVRIMTLFQVHCLWDFFVMLKRLVWCKLLYNMYRKL